MILISRVLNDRISKDPESGHYFFNGVLSYYRNHCLKLEQDLYLWSTALWKLRILWFVAKYFQSAKFIYKIISAKYISKQPIQILFVLSFIYLYIMIIIFVIEMIIISWYLIISSGLETPGKDEETIATTNDSKVPIAQKTVAVGREPPTNPALQCVCISKKLLYAIHFICFRLSLAKVEPHSSFIDKLWI